MRPVRASLAALIVVAPFAACGSPPPPLMPPPAPDPEPVVTHAPPPEPVAPEPEPEPPPAPVKASPCPEGMQFVDGTFCPKVERKCLKTEENKPNHLTLCHRFEHETKCLAPEEKRSFCIDTYEYPNEKGAHPPWMVSWYDAEATCQSKGKRLCHETEWVMACEGPDKTPFPYGWDRDQTACNIDNTWIDPKKNKSKQMAMYSSDAAVRDAELERLDQSAASGAFERCVSGYGVHDLTGNFDEWVTRDTKPGAKDKSKWAGLKGGAWGHVRNACRPMTTSHEPEFTYYFVSFRCCADAKDRPPSALPAGVPTPPKVEPKDRAPLPHPRHSTGPSSRKVQPEN